MDTNESVRSDGVLLRGKLTGCIYTAFFRYWVRRVLVLSDKKIFSESYVWNTLLGRDDWILYRCVLWLTGHVANNTITASKETWEGSRKA